MFVVVIHYKQTIDVIDKHLIEHRNFLESGYQKSYLIASGPQNPRTGGILISQLADKNTLENFLKHDPFLVNDVADYEIIEFTPVKYHPDFAGFVV